MCRHCTLRYTRRMLARRRVGNMRAAASAAEEAWATADVRDAEAEAVEGRRHVHVLCRSHRA